MVKNLHSLLRQWVRVTTFVTLSLSSFVSHAFVVNAIELEGASRIEYSSIEQHVSIAKGGFLDNHQSQQIIQSLYKTGFFQDVALYKKGDGILVIRVVERPSIAEVKIDGNQLIETEILKDALDGLGIKQGRIYKQVELDRISIDLERRYQSQGYYAAKVKIDKTELPRNRVQLTINIEEGEPAQIGRITLVGNSIYSDQRLKAQMQMAEGDEYSRPILQADIETLKSYYMDRGFARFQVKSSQVSLSNDKTRVFTTINMEEGEQYFVGDVSFLGEMVVPEKELAELFTLKRKDVFSRAKVIAAVNAMRDRMSEEGYAFAEIEPLTTLNEDDNTISLAFDLKPSHRIYIRRVEIQGNTRTRDHVVRREIRQLESAPYSLGLVRQSQSRLDRLGYFSSANIETKRVSADQVDLVVHISEQPTGSISAGVGYSQLDGFSFNMGLSERNFIGSGNQLDFKLASSSSKKTADIGITNPYFTDDGVSLGVGFYLSEIDASELDIADYSTNNMGLRTTISYPLSENDSFHYGFRFDSQDLLCSSVFNVCNDHVNTYGKNASATIFSMGWSHNSTNSFYFPSTGHKARISVESVIPATSDLPYYKAYLQETWYRPLSQNIALQMRGSLSYGSGFGSITSLPFYQRFYSGGIGSVRGFEPNSLGPYYDLAIDGSNRPKGGDAVVETGAALVLPIPFMDDSTTMRMSLFFDAGNVYNNVDTVDLGLMRSSVGLGLAWITPVGPLSFSLAEPVGYDATDKLQKFQFSLGAAF